MVLVRKQEELLLRRKVETDALYAGYIRKLALKGEKKETVLKAVEKIFEDLVVPKFGVTGYELASGERNFEYRKINETLMSRVKEEYGLSAVPYAQEYMDMVMESIINNNHRDITARSGMAFSSTSETRQVTELPA